jgi:hypothetical protein
MELLVAEMERLEIDVLGLAETKLTGQGQKAAPNGHVLVHCGVPSGSPRARGVGFLVNKRIAGEILGFNPVSDRIVTLRLAAKPCNVTVVQVYAPTEVATTEAKDDFLETLQTMLDSIPARDVLFLIGDFNSRLGEGSPVGKHALGEMNENGRRLTELALANGLVAANAQVKQRAREVYGARGKRTW